MGFSPILKTKVTIQVFPKDNKMTVTYQIVSHQDVVRMVTNEEFTENGGRTTRQRKGTCSLLDRAFGWFGLKGIIVEFVKKMVLQHLNEFDSEFEVLLTDGSQADWLNIVNGDWKPLKGQPQ